MRACLLGRRGCCAESSPSLSWKRHYEKVLQKLNQRFLEHCIWRVQDLAENDRDEAIKLLQGYFTPEFVISSCLSKLSDRDAEIASCLSKLSDRDAEIASCLSKLSDRDAEIASYREQNQKLKQKAERYDKIANTVRPFAPEGSRRRRLARFVLKKLYRYLRPKEKG